MRREFDAAWPVFVFFLTGFLLLLLLVKLALAQFSIEVRALSNALVGALVAAKAALVLDETPLARRLERYPRIVAVVVKTVFYGIVSLLMGYLERFLEAFHKVHHFDEAIRNVVEHVNHNRLLAWALGISIVFALYFSFFEISQRMGEGELARLFFESGAPSNRSERNSQMGSGGGRVESRQ
ncbi:MAG TPA: hypothetical protein VGI36_17095 [Candidatus Binataceae bacterium]